jgi:hypothetical protein
VVVVDGALIKFAETNGNRVEIKNNTAPVNEGTARVKSEARGQEQSLQRIN